MDLTGMRTSYERGDLDETASSGNPVEQFGRWFADHLYAIAGAFQLLHGVVQVGEVLGPHAQGHARLSSDGVHGLPVVGGSAV